MIKHNDEVKYIGATFAETEHMWMDGMLEVTAHSWDIDNHKVIQSQVGYYGCDGQNMCGCTWKIDIDTNTARDMIRTIKAVAYERFAESVTRDKARPQKGRNCVVVKGRKVKKGTKLSVFWVGEKPTYMAKSRPWMHETETICGCYDESGEKVWIKAEYLKVVDPVKSPSRKERDAFIKAYVKGNVPVNVLKLARG